MKTTFEKVRLWLYLPLLGVGVLFALYYTLTAPAGVSFDRFAASVTALSPLGVFAVGLLPKGQNVRHRLPLISAGVHLATDLLFAFCARIDRPYGVSAWSYFRSLEFLCVAAVLIAALLLCSRKSFAVLSGIVSFGLLITFHETGLFRMAGFALHLLYFVMLALFAWDSLPDTDGILKFLGWLFEKDAEIEEDTPVTERHAVWDHYAPPYGALEEDPFDEEEEEDGHLGDL